MDIREYLKQNKLFTDGAMGTYYASLNDSTDIVPEYRNINNPDLIKRIHMEYLRAGAGLIRTNTFLANTQSLSLDKEEVSRIIKAAVRIAKEAVAKYKEESRDDRNNPVFIAGSIGPIPDNALSEEEEIYKEYCMLADDMLDEGVDAILFETFSEAEYILKTADYIRAKNCNIFIIAQVTLNAGGYSGNGMSGKRMLSYLARSASIDACGFNCGIGSGHMLKILKNLVLPENKYIIVSPNSAYPEKLQSRMMFMDNKTYFAKNMNEIAELGVDIIGACCGTSPDYIKEVKKNISNANICKGANISQEIRVHSIKRDDKVKNCLKYKIKNVNNCLNDKIENEKNKIEDVKNVNLEDAIINKKIEKISNTVSRNNTVRRNNTDSRNNADSRNNIKSISNMLKQGIKVTAVELDPPYNANDSRIIEAAKILKGCGVDIITIADSPMGRSRIDSILMSSKLINNIGIPVMPHICCRDRNMIAMRSALLGAYINDIRNLLIVTGDPVPEGLKGSTKAVFDYNSIQLMKYIKEMNEEHFPREPFTYGGALNYRVKNTDITAKRMIKKMEAGAGYFLTQPIYTDEDVDSVRYLKNITGAKILCGIMPLVSYKNAAFIKNEITGIHLPDEILNRYHEGMSRDEGEEAGAELAMEIIDMLGDAADGYYFMLPFNRVSLMQRIQKKLQKIRQNGI